jgi:hypothetical protein
MGYPINEANYGFFLKLTNFFKEICNILYKITFGIFFGIEKASFHPIITTLFLINFSQKLANLLFLRSEVITFAA